MTYDAVFYVPTVGRLLSADPDHPPGGAETQVRLVAQALTAQGVRVAVIVFDQPGLPGHDGDVAVMRRPPHQPNPLAEAAAVVRSVRGVPSRVVVSRQAAAHTGLVALAAKASGRRFVYSAANVLDFDFGSWESNPGKRALFELGLRLADDVVAQTDEQRTLYARKTGRLATVIRSIAEMAPPQNAVPEAFLWVGRVVGYKQPLEYVRLAAALPEAQFWMVAVPDEGLEEDRLLLQELRSRAAAVPNLSLLPPRPREEVLKLMDRAVAIVSTSRSEGMPNIWLEGWARGVPALTLSHDPDDLVARNGLGAALRGDTVRFRDEARRMWQQRMDAGELAACCRDYVRGAHSSDAVGAAWRDVIACA